MSQTNTQQQGEAGTRACWSAFSSLLSLPVVLLSRVLSESFEVLTDDGFVLHSRLATGRFPNADEIIERLRDRIHAHHQLSCDMPDADDDVRAASSAFERDAARRQSRLRVTRWLLAAGTAAATLVLTTAACLRWKPFGSGANANPTPHANNGGDRPRA